MRGTFANIRLKNEMLVPGSKAADTYLPTGEQMTIYDAAMPTSAGRAARRDRRQGVRHRLVARLGGEGHLAARASRR